MSDLNDLLTCRRLMAVPYDIDTDLIHVNMGLYTHISDTNCAVYDAIMYD